MSKGCTHSSRAIDSSQFSLLAASSRRISACTGPRRDADMNDSTDPAEKGYLRFYYRDRRPTRFGRFSNRAWAWVCGLGFTPQWLVTLRVRSKKSHRLYSTILVAANYRDQRYLVSMLGNGSNWVQDVRAALGEAFIKRGRSRPVMLTEIPPEQRAPILKAWCKIATSGRQHMPVPYDAPPSAFNAIASEYPVFRIDPVIHPSTR